ncbi:hypothetical protein ABIA33_007345 [Streptacidiphilus sp. MAP12-16]|uniref:hypothetical protein n=1 Tax=Streptacidiphilus sp. MAP12-16 TaxID=3156300 RepID=UPI0035173952
MNRTHTIRTSSRNQSQARPQDLGVPLSVWLTDPLTGCCQVCREPASAACAQRLPLGLVQQITEAFSKPGEVVFTPDAGNASALIAPARCGRKVYGLVRGSDHGRRTHQRFTDEAAEVASLAIIRNAPVPGALASQSQRIASRAALAILAPHTPTTSIELAALIDSCARALRPDGVLVIAARQAAGQDLAGHLVVHAQAAGLVYLQHIVAVEATAGQGRLIPTAADGSDHGPNCGGHPTGPGAGRHALVHNDLLVFTRP